VCGICGVVAKVGTSDTAGLVLRMLQEMSHRGPDSAGIAWDGGSMTAPNLDDLLAGASTVRAPRTLGHARLRITGGDRGRQPFVDRARRLSLVFNGEIYNYRELARRFGGPRTDTDGEVLFHLLGGAHEKDGMDAVHRILPDLDGVYAFAMMDSEAVILARDRVGVKQVYFGENDRLVAFASERKALWRIGMRSHRLDPGRTLRMSSCGVILGHGRPLPVLPVAYTDRVKAKAVYRRVVMEAVRKRVEGHGKVGVLFSGGVDSVLIARLAAGLCNEVIAYAGGVPGSPDLTLAMKAARSIGIPIRVRELDAGTIEKLVPETVAAIEDGDLLQVEAAIPMYAALGLAREDGVRVMLTGQGADELFAGYEWYPPILYEEGEQALLACQWSDLTNLYRDTLEREDKMSMAHSIELRVPFLDPAVIAEAMRISPRLNIDTAEGAHDPLRKRLHRELALDLGVPRSIAMRLKDGVQHGSGIHRALEAIARRHAPLAPCAVLDLDDSEQRGSAFRHAGFDVRGGAYGSEEARAYVNAAALAVFEPVVGRAG